MIKSQLNEIWSETLKVIQNKINRPSFDTWFNQTELVAYYDENFIIKTPNNIVKDWLNNNYIEVMYIEVDEDHVSLQRGTCAEPRLIYVHEGK